jgi:hypothetical protein
MAAGNTYEAIATTTLSSAAASVTLSSIPQTYTDLIIVCNLSTTSSSARGGIQLNNDGSALYSFTHLSGNGTSASTSRGTGTGWCDWYAGTTLPANTQISMISHIQNYTNTTTYKSVLSRAGAASNLTQASISLYRSTSAISVVSVSSLNGGFLFDAGSTFSLYGIKAA